MKDIPVLYLLILKEMPGECAPKFIQKANTGKDKEKMNKNAKKMFFL